MHCKLLNKWYTNFLGNCTNLHNDEISIILDYMIYDIDKQPFNEKYKLLGEHGMDLSPLLHTYKHYNRSIPFCIWNYYLYGLCHGGYVALLHKIYASRFISFSIYDCREILKHCFVISHTYYSYSGKLNVLLYISMVMGNITFNAVKIYADEIVQKASLINKQHKQRKYNKYTQQCNIECSYFYDNILLSSL